MVFKNVDHPKSGTIKITHYVSPHEFWFKYLDDDSDHEIQERIQRFGSVIKNNHQNHAPSIGDIVIVQCRFDDACKYFRARVDCELKYSSGSEFILWAIDEGFPIRSSSKWIIKLTSDDLKNANTRVFKATLNRIVPATPKFDFLQEKSVMTKTSSWSRKVINEFEKISNAESLIFHYDCHAAERHIYGSLVVNSFTGRSINMDDLLKSLEEAVDAENFEKEYQKLVQKDYWVQEQDNYKIRANIMGTMHTSDVKALEPTNIQDINTVDKINEWTKRNQRSLSSTKDTDPNSSLAQKVQECNLDELPLNKRYEHCSKLNVTQQPCTSKSGNLSKIPGTSKIESPNDSFYSAEASLRQNDQTLKVSVSKDHFKKALQSESFSTRPQDRVLMHCRDGVAALSISSIAEANFTDTIHERLKKLHIDQVYRTQAVGWPHLMRRHSLIVINAAETGKTWTYLPAVCSLLLEAHTDEKIVNCEGPVTIILCLDSASVNIVQQRCKALLQAQCSCVAYTQYDTENIQYELLNGIDILITTVPGLLRLMKNPIGLLNKKRMTTIVFDEIDGMSDRYGENEIQTIYKALCNCTEVQTIVTSKTWHKTLKKFWAKDDLLLCIGAFIEAAIYSNADITVQSTNDDNRCRDFLSCFKRRNYTDEQTIVVCSESQEVLQIEKILQGEGYSKASYCHDKTDSEKIASINALNRTDAIGVLVCTDDVLGDLWIRNAQHIIHFSLPDKWTTFTKRFIASFDYYHDMIGDKLTAGQPTSVVFVDVNSCDSLPRLVEFMRTRCHARVPNNILDMAETKRIEREERLTAKKLLCENMLLLGVCYKKYTCKFRHILTRIDRPDDTIPKRGQIKFEILSIRSPAHFSVRLLEHYSSERNGWQKMPHLDDYFSFRTKFDKYFNEDVNHHIHHPVEIGDFCVMDVSEDGTGQFERCEIIAIDGPKKITTLLIDSNDTMTCLKATELLVLPDQFKQQPRQAVDVRIADVVPLDLSTTWDDNAKTVVQNWVDRNKKCQLQATIELTLRNGIWVKSVEIVEKLKSIEEELVEFDFKKEIISNNLGVADVKSLQLLRHMAKKAGILDAEPPHVRPLEVTKERCGSAEPCLPLKHLLSLANNQERGRGRGKVLSHSSSESVNSATSSPRTNQLDMIRAPFNSSTPAAPDEKVKSNSQKPTAALTVANQWATLTPDTFNEFDLGEFYSPDRFYVLLASEFQRFNKLRQEIAEFTRVPKNSKPLINVEVGRLCLAAAQSGDDCNEMKDYRRAQIVKVHQQMVRIFLVDYGMEEYGVPVNDLIEIPETLIKRLPFQAIHCKMTGIRPANDAEYWSEQACAEICKTFIDSLFVRPTGKPSVSNDIMRCNSYDCVVADKELKEIVNELVVHNGYAELDPQTKHFIDVTVDWESLQFVEEEEDMEDMEEDWDSDNGNQSNTNRIEAKEKEAKFSFDGSVEQFDVQVDVPKHEMEEWLRRLKDANLLADTSQSANAIESIRPANTVVTSKKTPTKNGEPFSNERIKSIESLGGKLMHPSKQPYIEWTQTDEMVKLGIHAPDVKDYSLVVGSLYVKFCFIVNNERFENILNLFGCVDAKYTTHDVRGLNIVVRLKKTLMGIRWPRLERSPDKNRFIKCIIVGDDDDDEEENSANDRLPLQCVNNNDDTSTSGEDDDDEDDGIMGDIEY